MTTVESESSTRRSADQGDYAIQLRTRRNVLAGTAAAVALATSGLLIDQRVRAKDEDEDGDDRSGHGGRGEDDRTDDDRHGLPPDQSTQVAGVAIVQIIDERFEPNNILIETGQTVTWVNRDDDSHTASGPGMDTGIIDPGAEGSVTFLEPGVFPYTCNFHPEMLGEVTVTGQSQATPEPTTGNDVGAAPMTADVAIVDFAFNPEIVTIAVGGTVTWTNTGQAPHTIFADWANSDIMDPGAAFSWTFEAAGNYDYICGLHPAMTGTIEVVAATVGEIGTPQLGASVDPAGIWRIDYSFDDPDQLLNQQALVSFEPTGVLHVDMVPESEPRAATDGHGTWTTREDDTIESVWFMLFRDATSGEVSTVRIVDVARVESDGAYAGSVEGDVMTANGATTRVTGASVGRRLAL